MGGQSIYYKTTVHTNLIPNSLPLQHYSSVMLSLSNRTTVPEAIKFINTISLVDKSGISPGVRNDLNIVDKHFFFSF
jgi:hypothetical protein